MRQSLRALCLILLAALPGLILLVWASLQARAEGKQELVRDSGVLAQMLAREQDRVFDNLRVLLGTLSRSPELSSRGPRCAELLRSVVNDHDHLVALTVAGTDRVIRCSSLPILEGRLNHDSIWFRRILETREFTVGNYITGPNTGVPMILAGFPAIAEDSSINVIAAALDVGKLIAPITRLPIPEGATITVFDRNARVVARYPDPEGITGGRFAATPLAAAARRGAAIETVGLDGVERVFSFAKMQWAPESGVVVAVGIPSATAYGYARSISWQAALAVALTLIFALFFARSRAVADANRAISNRKKSERFFELIIERAFDAVVIIGADRNIMYASPAVERITGYRPEDVIGIPLRDFQVAGEAEASERFNAMIEKPGTVFRAPFLHRSGQVRQVEFTGRNMLDDSELPGIIINFRDITDQVDAEQSVRESRDELRDLARRMQSRIEDERRRIAREVHDDLGQYVAALGLDVAWLQRSDWRDNPQMDQRLKEMQQLVTATSQSVRRIAQQLHGGVVEGLSLSDAIRGHLRQFEQRAQVEVISDIQAVELDMSRDVVTAAFRIVQEALTNVARHSKATRVRVCLRERGEELHLEVHDNGKGMTSTTKHGGGLGILSMRERAGACGGTVRVESSPDGGVAVIATFPI